LKPVHVFHSLIFLENEGYLHFTDGFFIPSQVMFKVNRQQLYNFQVKYEQYDPLLKTLLRNYTGIMEDFGKINERQLAKILARPYSEIIAQLKKLEEYNILFYKLQTEKPQLTYLLPRMSKENLKLDAERYLFRYQVKKKNIEAVVRYASGKKVCRSRKLLAYFDEKNAKVCGQCDVCLGRNEKKINSIELDKIEDLVKVSLERNPQDVEQLIANLSKVRKEKVIETVRLMMDEGTIVMDQNNVLNWKK